MTLDPAGQMQARFAVAADAVACNELYNRLHGTDRTQAQWEWEFAPDGQDPFAYVVLENDGAIAGLQALLPIRLISADGIYRTAKSEDTLLDPIARGTGALASMYELLFERARSEEVAAIWGFTEATRAFTRLGFAVPGVTRRHVLPLSGGAASLATARLSGTRATALLPLLRMLMGILALSGTTLRRTARLRQGDAAVGLRITTAVSPPSECSSLMHAFVRLWGGVTILRDAEYLQWRVFSNPWVRPVMRCAYRGDTLLGWAIHVVDRDHVGYLVDIVVADTEQPSRTKEITRLLLADAVDGLAAQGAVAVVMMTANDHPFDGIVRSACRRLGFLKAGNGNPFVLWTAQHDSGLSRFDDWYITRIFTEGVNG